MAHRLSSANRLLLAAATLVAGEACGFAMHRFATLWPWLVLVAGLELLAAYGWRMRGVVFPAIFLLGAILAARTEAERQRVLDSTRFISHPPPLTVRVESKVNLWRSRRHDGWSADFLSHVGPVAVKVVLPVPAGTTPPSMGETWSCSGRLSSKQEDSNPFARQTLWVSSVSRARRISVARRDGMVRQNALASLLSRHASLGLDWSPEAAALNRAILLGQRTALSKERRKIFSAAGTIHVFAISGLHVMVIALALNGLLARLDVQIPARGLLVLPAVAAYVALTGMRASAIRAGMMLALYLLAPVFGRRPDARSAWSITAFLVYARSPERLFDLGCALSFAVMFGIVLWLEWSRRFLPLAEPGSRRQKLLGSMGVSFAAWVAGVPITAHAFGQFSLGGLLANVVVIYCAGWMVRFGVFGLAAGFVCALLAAVANNMAALCTCAMVAVSEAVAQLPFSLVSTPGWTGWHSVAWYAAWLAILHVAGRLFRRKAPYSATWWPT